MATQHVMRMVLGELLRLLLCDMVKNYPLSFLVSKA